MRLKKICLFCIFFFVFNGTIFSQSLDEILSRAYINSEQYKKYAKSYSDYKFQTKLLEYDMQDSYEVGLKSSSISADDFNLSQDVNINLTPFATYTSGDDNTTSISLEMPFKIYAAEQTQEQEEGENQDFTPDSFNPSLGISKKLIIDRVKDERRNISIKKAKIKEEGYAKKYQLQFDLSVYNTISNILSSKSSYSVKKSKYEKINKEFSNLVEKELITKGTYSYKIRENELLQYENELHQAETTYINSLKDFQNLCGFEFDSVDNIPEVELSFEIKEEGNTDVKEAYLDMLKAKNEYEMQLKNSSRILSLSANMDMNMDVSDKNILNYNLQGSVSYQDEHWKSKVGLKGRFDNIRKVSSPLVDFSFSYNIGSNTSSIDRINKERALIDYEDKSFQYQNTLFNYNTNAYNMQNKILMAKINKNKEKQAYENARAEFENRKQLFEKEYISEYEFAVDSATFQEAENNYKSFLLSLLVLDCDSKILNY